MELQKSNAADGAPSRVDPVAAGPGVEVRRLITDAMTQFIERHPLEAMTNPYILGFSDGPHLATTIAFGSQEERAQYVEAQQLQGYETRDLN